MKKIGFIGMGNMAKAMAMGFIATGKVAADHMYAYAPNQEKLAKNAEEVGFQPCSDVEELVKASDVVVMACKPYQIEGVLGKVGSLLAGKVLLSVAIGWDFETYAKHVDPSTRVQYILPNTPCQVGEGVFLVEKENSLNDEEKAWLQELLSACGTVVELPGHLIGPGSGVSGCGPAFVSMMMEAMADAAVKHGIPRGEAYKMVAQMVVGTGKLMLKTGQHPGVMKDAVCSPGGTTIRGVIALEHAGMRAAFMDAVDAASGK
ncbi:MAG: pyrroline-5-carboxylate reductase [Firmicutes bacterium]|nr:pyrroline-5-carboxylate reductase [Bacillota bacterium]